MPNELAYERELELPGRVLMRVVGPRNVCIVDGLRYETDAEFEVEGLVAKRFLDFGVAEIVRKLRPRKKSKLGSPRRRSA